MKVKNSGRQQQTSSRQRLTKQKIRQFKKMETRTGRPGTGKFDNEKSVKINYCWNF